MTEGKGIEFGQKKETSIERLGNIVTIRKPEGVYTISYGIHTRAENSPQGLSESYDGVCFEGGLNPYPPTHEELQLFGTGNQRPLFEYARSNGLPIFAADCSVSPLALLEELEVGIELAAGAVLFKKLVKPKKISRRDFLRFAGMGVALYLSLPTISLLGQFGSSISGAGENETAELAKITQRIHPEYKIFLLSVRDAVLAQKMQFLLENTNQAHLVTPRGAEHIGIEDMILASEEERVDFLERLRPVLPKLVLPETFYKIVKYEINSGEWKIDEVFEEPALKRIMTNP